MARMLGKVSPPWCNICKAAPGPDCPDEGKDKRQVRAIERRELAEILDEMVREAAEFGLYEATAEPVDIR